MSIVYWSHPFRCSRSLSRSVHSPESRLEMLEVQSYCACIPLRSGIPHYQWTQCISALSLSHQPASQLYPSSHLIRVSSLFNVLAILCLELRSCLNPQTAQALSQVSDRSGRVSSLRSCFEFKPRFAASQSTVQRWRKGVYIERAAHPIF